MSLSLAFNRGAGRHQLWPHGAFFALEEPLLPDTIARRFFFQKFARGVRRGTAYKPLTTLILRPMYLTLNRVAESIVGVKYETKMEEM